MRQLSTVLAATCKIAGPIDLVQLPIFADFGFAYSNDPVTNNTAAAASSSTLSEVSRRSISLPGTEDRHGHRIFDYIARPFA